jgi:hypothetical protein
MPGWPKDAEAKKALRALRKEYGWQYPLPLGSSAHGAGLLACGDGCRFVVNGTASNTARVLWSFARKCPHGHAPDRRQW